MTVPTGAKQALHSPQPALALQEPGKPRTHNGAGKKPIAAEASHNPSVDSRVSGARQSCDVKRSADRLLAKHWIRQQREA